MSWPNLQCRIGFKLNSVSTISEFLTDTYKTVKGGLQESILHMVNWPSIQHVSTDGKNARGTCLAG